MGVPSPRAIGRAVLGGTIQYGLPIFPWAIRLALRLLPLTVFVFVWQYVRSTFYSTSGKALHRPAWPTGRSWLVWSMFAIPLWGATMLVIALVQRRLGSRLNLLRERHQEQYYQLINTSLRPLMGSYHDDDLEDNGEDLAELAARRSAASKSPAPTSRPSRIPNLSSLGTLIYSSAIVLGLFLWVTRECSHDWKYRTDIDRATAHRRARGYGNGEKVFIAGLFFNNSVVLPFWSEQFLRLVDYIGSDNVYVSIVESNSKDGTQELLEDFASKLTEHGIRHSVSLNDSSIPNWRIEHTEHARVSFLSEARNLAMQPMIDEARHNRFYNRVLWSNDVFVHAESAVQLLQANNGDYDMACALDFAWYGVYDSWVIRDRLGALTSTVWPYFFEEDSMRAVMNDRPAQVFSCWNGMAAIRAAPFLPPDLRARAAIYANVSFSGAPLYPPLALSHPLHDSHRVTPPSEQPELSFRASTAQECFSSECFNLPYDLRRRFGMGNIIVVPNVVTAYAWHHYVWFKYVVRHWLVRWWMRHIERGATMIEGKSIIGPPEQVYVWDGGWCQPGINGTWV
ncbi:cryptococcal mannosyltransferase 1-domain-containing protein [Auriculariales sp. MPI-PUGE-AT-0066]|nr:cryptococcal mannosyltransferase 1-domain-containing protein [Auriculariales sp. MPI-PUGE-AT-0066]